MTCRLFFTPVLLCLLALSTWSDADSHAKGEGFVIRVEMGDLVYIDLGEGSGVARGDLFDILADEVITHPLTGDTLAVTPMSVGALQVRQVFPKMAAAKLVHIAAGEDPMLKPIVRIRDPKRHEEIAKIMSRNLSRAMGRDVPRQVTAIPGLYQIRIGEKRKGWTLISAEAASLIAGFSYRTNSNDWYDQYSNLPAGLPESEYTFYIDRARSRRDWSNRFFWLAGALYAYNWVDILWLGTAASLSGPVEVGEPAATSVCLGTNSTGQPLMRLTHRF
ncbi:MAG: FlgT C-terminal domain-containing protein [Candidatus Latescibacterota bacterium]|nr:FlgT C-terminal domain-containing protein [Candidatus Latescibacterota bacterium]